MRISLSTHSARGLRMGLILAVVVAAAIAPLAGAAAAPAKNVIVLPGATSTEGIAVGRGSTFYAGDLFLGDIFRGDLQRGTAELFIDAPADGRMAVGMKLDATGKRLFVASGTTGAA